MADVDEIAQRLQIMESETRASEKEILQRLARLEAKIDVLGDGSVHTNQSRQQDRWAGGLWLAAWVVFTILFAGGFVVALLTYLQP